MSDDVIKQFMVGLRFKVDQQGERRVTETITSITKAAGTLALALEAAALAAAVAVAKIAASFDTLYYTSQRTGASVQNIKGLSFALSQVGGSSGQATAAIESFSRAMRTNPGVGQFVKDLGVTTTAGGKARDTIDVLADAIDAIQKKHPYYVGAQMAGLLGIDEGTFNTLSRYREEIKAYRQEYDRTATRIGLNNDEAAKSSTAFMHALRSLQGAVVAVAEKIGTDLLPIATKYLKAIQDWVEAHPKEIEDAIRAIGAAALALAVAFGDIAKALTPVALGFQKIAEGLTGHEGLQASMEAFAAFLVGTWLVRILGAFGAVGTGWTGLLAILGLGAAANQAGILAPGRSGQPGVGRGALEFLDPGLADRVYGRGTQKDDSNQPGLFRRGWNAVKRGLGVGEQSAGGNAGTGIGRRGRRAAEADKTNYNFTGENADVLRQAAAQLGTSPEDLATVISYESKFNSKRWGGKGGNYLGLIQFGGPERAQFGVNDQQSFKEQMPAVVRFLKTRGFKPGMGLMDLYSTINAGQPGRYNASDGNGTVRSHTERMRTQEAARVARFLASGSGSGAQAAPAPPPLNFPTFGKGVGGFDVNALGAAPPLGGNTTNNGATVTMNHETHVKIDAGGDPATAGAQVERAVNRSNDLSLRNAQTAIR